jgi:hypothetical protein
MWHTYLSMLDGMAGLLRFQAADLDLLESGRGFEPATLTLARCLSSSATSWRIL